MISSLLATIIFLWHFALAELYKPANSIQCSHSAQCPQDWPCCSQYGECGAGPMCIIGCNPKFSFHEDSCTPMPGLIFPDNLYYMSSYSSESKKNNNPSVLNKIEKRDLNREYNFHSFERMNPTDDITINNVGLKMKQRRFINHVEYLMTSNDTEAEIMLQEYDFTYSGFTDIDNSTDEIILKMPKKSTGSLLSSARVMLYGKISINMRTARSRGVISAIVLMSATGDEIDFEFLGGDLFGVQTNYYSQGELVYSNMHHHHVFPDTSQNDHLYEIDWKRDHITWLIDGKEVRKLYKKDTWDPSLRNYKYPQTPMRLEVAIWPGGAETNALGTIAWAGGPIDWENSEDMRTTGYFHIDINAIQMIPFQNKFTNVFEECYNALDDDDKIIPDVAIRNTKAVYIYDGIQNKFANEGSLSINCNHITRIKGYSNSNLNSLGIDYNKIYRLNDIQSGERSLNEIARRDERINNRNINKKSSIVPNLINNELLKNNINTITSNSDSLYKCFNPIFIVSKLMEQYLSYIFFDWWH
ncbi:hypothetical protein TPHA_0J01630 [Tetrapisispora phaffii CBS 4417]|uniref:GH16 domain-containing protein n=1 Tax=Tetrapisispora phaffii (strain ATCC 24235 / CBS 4417 / NBRC 1672 / NRRL Y-8282 / UCD 70-5) TaxID=1071381 RepID=G8BYP2_TETPH|nr:hypothetical protein TPHA_0J01630 [Tetrapisispora phaffii CBS 4417]CCE64984.1 hypothetical protein TPHA_0J01630 [Tetrapisispora phaffii CBS 4417]